MAPVRPEKGIKANNAFKNHRSQMQVLLGKSILSILLQLLSGMQQHVSYVLCVGDVCSAFGPNHGQEHIDARLLLVWLVEQLNGSIVVCAHVLEVILAVNAALIWSKWDRPFVLGCLNYPQ